MLISELKNNEKLDFITSTKDLFNKGELYTKYTIFKIKDELYLFYKGVNFIGNELFCCNKIKHLESVLISEGDNVTLSNTVMLNTMLQGIYTNGLEFKFSKVEKLILGQLTNIEKRKLYKEIAYA